MVKPIYLYGSEVLRQVASELDITKKEEIKELIQDLKDTLQVADGCGLAAPQIGVSSRALIVDGRELSDVYDYLKDFERVMINPKIIWESESTCQYNEGCLSIPGIYADVVRPEKIRVEYYNENLEKCEEEFEGFACRMVQHEMSHLDGDLFVDRVAPIRRKIISKKLVNIATGKVGARYKTKLK